MTNDVSRQQALDALEDLYSDCQKEYGRIEEGSPLAKRYKTIRNFIQQPETAPVDVGRLKKPKSDRYPTSKNEIHCFNEGWNQCVDYLAANGHLSGRDEWKTIDSAPDEGKVWIYGGRWEKPSLQLADGSFWRMRINEGSAQQPTHWHPEYIPTPPKEQL